MENKMKNVKRITAIILSVMMMTVIFAGCGKSQNIKYSDTTHLFRQTEITIPKDYEQVQDSVFLGGKFYLLAFKSEPKFVPIPETGHPYAQWMSPEELTTASDGTPIPDGMMETSIGYTTIIILDESGNILEEKDLVVSDYSVQSDTSVSYSSLFVSPDGRLLMSKRTDTNTTDADGNFSSKSENVIMAFDENWNETPYFNMTKALESNPDPNLQYFFPDQMIFKGDYLYAYTYDGVYVFDVPNVKYLFSLTQEQGSSNGGEWFQGIFDLGSEVALSVQTQSRQGDNFTSENKLKVIDPTAQKFGTAYDFSAGQSGTSKPGNADYPIVVASGSELSAVNYQTGEKTLLIDFLASGYAMQNFDSVMIMDENRFAMIISEPNFIPAGLNSWSASSSTVKIVIFEKIPEEEQKPRQVISVYCYYEDPNFLEFAADFNKKNTEYEIEMKIYNEDYTEQSEDVIARLNNDILSGNIPDILLLNSNVPYDSYVSKGLFYDINKYLAKDKELSRDDINADVLRVLESDGKLYSITKDFYVSAVMGKKSVFGDTETLTAEKVRELLAEYPKATLFGQSTQATFINQMVTSQIGSFVDKETGEVKFDTPEFIEILEMAKTLPAEIDNDNYDYTLYERMFTEDLALVTPVYVSDFRSIIQEQYDRFGEEVTVMGFPNPSNSGIALSPSLELSIMSGGNRDAAFEVIKGYMLFENPNPMRSYGLPAIESKLDAEAEAAKAPMTYIDPVTGLEKQAKNTIQRGMGDEIEYPNNTDADNQRIYDLMAKMDSVVRTDDSLSKIIEEETSAFFAGSKTAEECAKLIQDRASTYIAESR
jgi:hypothetical protein